MIHSRLIAIACILTPGLALATEAPDTTEWTCSLCPFPMGSYTDIDAGLGYVTDDAYRFGDYRGTDDKGAIVLGEIDWRYWSDSGRYWEVTGTDLGLDPSILVQGGRPGRYSLRLSYDAISKRLFDTAMTPFSGSATLNLPGGWVTGGSPSAMTQLSSSLRPIEIGRDRETLGLGLAFIQSDRLEYTIDYRHLERSGTGVLGGSFITQSTLLPEPIDDVTDSVEAGMTYTTGQGQVRLAYYGSFYNNTPHQLVWDNPFTALTAGATRGRASLAPDNQAHQLSLSGTTKLAAHTRLSGTVAVGRLEQDDLFIAATINPLIATAPLPTTALNGEVKTSKLSLRVDSRPMSKLRVRLEFDSDDRDNQTPRNDYEIVESDLFISGLRRNVPYSFARTRMTVKGDYQINRRLAASAGHDYEEVDRDFQEVVDTDEQTTWFGLRLRQNSKLSAMAVKFGHAEREGARYALPGDPISSQNPLLRKYNLANRDRDFVQASVSLSPSDRVDLGLSIEESDEDYELTTLGLTGSDTRQINVDAAILLSEKSSLTFFYGRDNIESLQAGSSVFGSPDWSAAIDDEIDTYSIGLRFPQLRDNLDLGLDYIFSDSTGRIALTRNGAGVDNFPDLGTRLEGARLYADYRPNDRYTVRVGYYYEKLKTRDWTLDGLAPDTLGSLLSLGVQSPNYSAGLFSLTVRVAFDPKN